MKKKITVTLSEEHLDLIRDFRLSHAINHGKLLTFSKALSLLLDDLKEKQKKMEKKLEFQKEFLLVPTHPTHSHLNPAMDPNALQDLDFFAFGLHCWLCLAGPKLYSEIVKETGNISIASEVKSLLEKKYAIREEIPT